MQRRSIKKYISPYFLVFSICILFSGIIHSYGQAEQQKYRDYIYQLKSVTDAPNLGYNYSVSLVDLRSGKTLDQINGAFLKSGKSYLDSNKNGLSLCSEGYILKTRASELQAVIYSARLIEKKMGAKGKSVLKSPVMAMPDSLLLKKGKFSSAESGDFLELKYVLHEKGNDIQEIHFKVRKKDMHLIEVKIFSPGAQAGTSRIFSLFDFTNEIDLKRISAKNYFKISGSKATTIGTLKSYTVQSFI